jgi:hypothetical protein
MTTISIKDEYAEILTSLGDLQAAIDLALQRYTIEQIANKITELKQTDMAYQTKYGLDYPTFAQRVAKDEAYVQKIETELTKLWEIDLAEWEFCHQGIEDWKRKLETILLV